MNTLIKISFMLFIAVTLSSCSSYYLEFGEKNHSKVNSIEEIKLISAKEKIKHNGKIVGDFYISENKAPDFITIKNKIKKMANKNGGNLLVFREVGISTSDSFFYGVGTLIYTDELDKITANEDSCCVYVINDIPNGIMTPGISSDIAIDGSIIKDLSENLVVKKKITDNCFNNIDISFNDEIYTLNLNGGNAYFRILRYYTPKNKYFLTIDGMPVIPRTYHHIDKTFLIEIGDEDIGRLFLKHIM